MGATLNWGKGFSFRKGFVLEIVLLRSKVDMMGKTFSSSFVRKLVLSNFCNHYLYLLRRVKRGYGKATSIRIGSAGRGKT